MDVNEINKKKIPGDFATAARMLGKSTEAVRQGWAIRTGSTFEGAYKALELIITTREQLINTFKK